MTVLNIRISETGGAPWKIEIDNLSREDATEGEKALADSVELATRDFLRGLMKPGTEVKQDEIPGSRV